MLLPFVGRIGIGSDTQHHQFLVVIVQCQVLEDRVRQIDDLNESVRAVAHIPKKLTLVGKFSNFSFTCAGSVAKSGYSICTLELTLLLKSSL